MKFKKIIPILLSFSYCFNSQCMEKHSSNSAELSLYIEDNRLGLYIPSRDYLLRRYNFYNYIVEKLYEHFLKYYAKYDDFTLKLSSFLRSIYDKKDNVDRYDKKDNVDRCDKKDNVDRCDKKDNVDRCDKKDSVDRYDKKDNVDPYKLPLESLIRTLTNFYHCLDRDNVLIEKNKKYLLNSWDKFLKCMEKHSSNSAKLPLYLEDNRLGLYIPSSDYLVGRDNFYNYIVEKLYEHFLKYYKKYGNFTLELNNFLCSIYGKKDNVDPYKLPLESLIRTLTNFYHCLDRDNVLIEKNEEDLLNSWDKFLRKI